MMDKDDLHVWQWLLNFQWYQEYKLLYLVHGTYTCEFKPGVFLRILSKTLQQLDAQANLIVEPSLLLEIYNDST